MIEVLYKNNNNIYKVYDISETAYLCYDNNGNRMWLPKEECLVI
jgi:hypothetical protein